MEIRDVHKALVEKFGESVILALVTETIDPWIEVVPASIADVGHYLKYDPALKFDYLNDLTAVDYFEPDEKKRDKFPHEPHLEVVYHMSSIPLRHRCKVKAKLPRWENGVEGDLPRIPTVSHIWAIANWHEREAYDLMGVFFEGHPNLERILCPDDWVGHALRKDYVQPLEYHGIRGR